MTTVVDHLLAMPTWLALLLVFALPALEASAFLGFVFPGETALILGGVMASQGAVPLPAVLAVGVGGAIVGDSIGYAVGRRWGRRILRSTVGRFVRPEHLDRAERALSVRGGWTVFVGRFTAALRVLVPGLAGMGRMPYRTFLLYNVSGALIWGSLMVVAGDVAGRNWHRVAHLFSGAGLVLTALVVGAFVAVQVVRRRRRASPPADG
ncbi:DedA family protein [Nocardioides sp. BP30]|uniref:DedA family protein n=1 Tax=Nocardioides sp. BP30 TaxID=3036374 RepID=UPI002469A15F|nr:DedA family protein [Nocardioides sp. BP30]WGL52360.1 DedA family protein [Nocardioides sp. BP30]